MSDTDNFSHRAGYAEDPLAVAIRYARKGGTLAAGEGALLVREIKRLSTCIGVADRRAGAAERNLEYAQERIAKNKEWLRQAKAERGVHDNVSFDVVWSDVCAKADAHDAALARAERAEAILAKLREPSEAVMLAGHLAPSFSITGYWAEVLAAAVAAAEAEVSAPPPSPTEPTATDVLFPGVQP